MPSTFPSAHGVAMALVTAAKLTGEDPIAIARGKKRSRARFVAIAALKEVHDKTPFTVLGRCYGVGPKSILSTTTSLYAMRKSAWWSEDWVDEVVGALVGDDEDMEPEPEAEPEAEPEPEPVRMHIHARRQGKSMAAETHKSLMTLADAAAVQFRGTIAAEAARKAAEIHNRLMNPPNAVAPGVEPVTPYREGSAEIAAAEADEARRWNKKAREDAQAMGLQVAFGLTATEAKLLDALCRMGAATMERLHAEVYGLDPNGGPDLKIVDVLICKLGKKLGDIEIETVWGSGYRLSAEARELIRTRAAQAIGENGRAAS